MVTLVETVVNQTLGNKTNYLGSRVCNDFEMSFWADFDRESEKILSLK